MLCRHIYREREGGGAKPFGLAVGASIDCIIVCIEEIWRVTVQLISVVAGESSFEFSCSVAQPRGQFVHKKGVHSTATVCSTSTVLGPRVALLSCDD
jgi:hypothetical protein